jgi:small subunit ribosomal protein S30e
VPVRTTPRSTTFGYAQQHLIENVGKVKSQTPKVEPQEKPKTPKGRAHKRIQYTRRFVNVTMTGGKRKVGYIHGYREHGIGLTFAKDEPRSYHLLNERTRTKHECRKRARETKLINVERQGTTAGDDGGSQWALRTVGRRGLGVAFDVELGSPAWDGFSIAARKCEMQHSPMESLVAFMRDPHVKRRFPLLPTLRRHTWVHIPPRLTRLSTVSVHPISGLQS